MGAKATHESESRKFEGMERKPRCKNFRFGNGKTFEKVSFLYQDLPQKKTVYAFKEEIIRNSTESHF